MSEFIEMISTAFENCRGSPGRQTWDTASGGLRAETPACHLQAREEI